MSTDRQKLTNHERQLLDLIKPHKKVNINVLANRFGVSRWQVLSQVVDLTARGIIPASKEHQPNDAIGVAVGYGVDPEAAPLAKELFSQARELEQSGQPVDLNDLPAAATLNAGAREFNAAAG